MRPSAVRANAYPFPRKLSGLDIRSLVRDGVLISYLVVNFTAISLVLSADDNGTIASGLSSEGSLFWQVVIPSFFGISILLLLSSQTPVRRVFEVAAPLLPLLIWIVLSITWSDLPEFTIRRAIRFAMESSTIVLFAAVYRDQYRMLKVLYFAFAFMVALDIVFLMMLDISLTSEGYAGIHYHKNNMGRFCLLALPVFLLAVIDRRIFSSRLISTLLAMCCMALLVLSSSKTSEPLAPICLLLTIGLTLMRRWSGVATSVTVLIAFCASAVLVLVVMSIGTDNLLTDTIGDATFSGRDRIWKYALSLFWDAPILGHGYGSIWDVGLYSVIQQKIFSITFVLKHAHNGYIDILAGLGIIGFLWLTIFLAVSFGRLWNQIATVTANRITFVAIYALFASCFENFTESTFSQLGSELWIYLLLMLFASRFIFLTSRV